MAGTRTLKLSILADVDNLNKNLKSGGKDVDSFGKKLADFGKKAALAFAAAAAAAGAMAIKIGKDAVIAASDLAETQSKVGVIFGDSADAIEEFASTAASSLGQTRTQALEAAANFAIFGKAAGLAGKDLIDFSTDFTVLASDLASFNNTTPEDAINAIGAALRGESEPLRRYGVLLNDASLRAKAMELGIYAGNGALTSQQKILAAQQLIFEQTNSAQGDFARTADGLANSQRILSARIENVKATIGVALLPIVNQAVAIFADKVLPVIEAVAQQFGSNEGLAGNVTKAVTVIRTVLQPVFDGLISLFNRVRNAIIANQDNFIAFADIIRKYVAPVLSEVLGGALRGLGVIAQAVITIIGKVVGIITKTVETAIAGINNLIKAYNKIPLLPNIPTISTGSTSIPTPSSPSIRAIERGVPTATSAGAAPVAPVTNNITVNGAIDSESTARQIAKVLTESASRGTGGGGGFVGGLLVT
jgi:hypothetical protein